MGDEAFAVVALVELMVGCLAARRVVADEHWTRPATLEEWVVRPVTVLAVVVQVAILLVGVVAGVVLGVRALVGL